jgi:predicted MFS family arabinose efflux permease
VSLHFGDAPTVSVTILLLGQLSALPSSAPQSRGVAMGAYTVFLDVALGFGSPALGLVAGRFGLDAAFLVSAR